MSAIDDVIARARQGEVGFSKRRQFKLARTRAIEKLRRFALADPYFYILELIQAAVAGGADYVDISCGEGDVLISWTGGCVREPELAQLFDFLFASKDRVDFANVRSLALGVNALLLFEPEQIVIESGDGTEGGTARMVVQGGAEAVEVGRAAGVLNGTYVRATKLQRDKVSKKTGRSGDDNGALEYATIELRCLAAPVPLVFNGQPLFGWARQRVPGLFGYKEVRSFDEGDLYGSIGRNPTGGEPTFQLMTHGVWIQSYQYELIPGQNFGGIICFDGLHKTVDHSGFVRDDRFEELWVRLRPYAEAIVGGMSTQVARITNVDGLEFAPSELRQLLREQPRVVICPPVEDEEITHRAKVIARLLDAQVLRVPASQATAVRVLGGRDLQLWQPCLDTDEDMSFYAAGPVELPQEPYLQPPVVLELPSLTELVVTLIGRGAPGNQAVDEAKIEASWMAIYVDLVTSHRVSAEAKRGSPQAKIKAMLRGLLGESGTISATLYSPIEAKTATLGLLVRVTAMGRVLGQQLYTSAYPGRVLVVELPTAQPSSMQALEIPGRVAEYFAALAAPVLRVQDQRALAGLGVGKIEVGSAAAHLALEVLSRATVTRLRGSRPGRLAPGLSFSLLRPGSSFDPYSLELLSTVSGRPVSLRALTLAMDETGGLVYGTLAEIPADLEGLDLDRVLALDSSSERILIGMLGEAGYVRIDARDVLTEHRGVKVRDMALGLREYPEFPLLIEGQLGQLETLDQAGREALLEALLAGLIARMHGKADEPGVPAGELEEHRRQAVRHLQWYACRQFAAGQGESLEALGLLELPLFLDLDGEAWGIGAVHAALCSDEGLLVHYGHALGSAELGTLTKLASRARAQQRGKGDADRPQGRPSSLAVSAFSYRLLVPLGPVRLAFDFDLDDVEAAGNPMTAGVAFLVRSEFESPHATGVLGIPATPLPEYRVALQARGRGTIGTFDELAHLYGVVGSLELSRATLDASVVETLYANVDEHASSLLEELIDRLPELGDDRERYAAAVRVLLRYAGEQMSFLASRVGLSAQVGTALAERILGLPLFDIGALTLVSAQRMIDRFRHHFDACHVLGESLPAIVWSQELAAVGEGRGAPGLTLEWLETHLQAAHVVMPASKGAGPGPKGAAAVTRAQSLDPWTRKGTLPLDVLAWNVEHWLEQLRPDGLEIRKCVTRIWMVDLEHAFEGMFAGGVQRLEIYSRAQVVVRVCKRPTPRNFAWLLLAVYAHINAALAPVTNAHEAKFQLAVGEALLEQHLQLFEMPVSA